MWGKGEETGVNRDGGSGKSKEGRAEAEAYAIFSLVRVHFELFLPSLGFVWGTRGRLTARAFSTSKRVTVRNVV